MSIQPDTDRQLAKTSGRLAANGAKLLALAIVLDVIGIVLLVADITLVGALFAFGLSMPLWLGATGLIGSGAVGKRASEQKDFA
jgi:heme O synthase-like polyprenyltransferase